METQSLTSQKINYVGKYAKVKNSVYLPQYDFTKIYGHPYKIVNQNKKATWICLEVIVKVISKFAEFTHVNEINKSFWMKVDECEIIN